MEREIPVLEKIISHIQTYKKSHLLWLSVITVFSVLSITGLRIGDRQILEGLRIDNSMEVWFREDDPTWLQYKRFQNYFEGDEFAIISFKVDDVFHPEVLEKIKDLTGKLYELPYILQVVSLTNTADFRGEGDVLEIRELFEKIPDDPARLKEIRTRVLNHPLYRGSVISEDGTTTAILVRIETQAQGINYQYEITNLLTELCERESEEGKYAFHIAGIPILVGMEEKASWDDAALEYPLSFIFLVVFLYLLHRRIVFVVVPLAVITVPNIWIHGVIPLCGSTYNMITNIIASVVMVIGIADAIHFISEYNSQIRKEKDSASAVRKAFKLVVLPCLFTSLTTAAGFMSMSISRLRPVKEFSIYVGIAMIMTFIVNMVLVSIWLSSLKKVPRETPASKDTGILHGLMRRVASINRRHVKINIVIALLVFLVSFTGIIRIEVNTHEIKYFRKNHPLRVATEFIEQNLTGTIPLEIMLFGPEDAFKEPDILQRLEKLEDFIGSIEQVQKTFSMVDFLKEINRVLNDEDPAFYRIPETRSAVAQLLLLTEGNDNELEHYVDFTSFSVARLSGNLNYIDNNEMAAINASIEQKISELFDPVGIRAEMAGSMPMYLNAMDYVMDSQFKGFSLALIVIFIMLSILVRSFKLGLLAMVPNIIPIFLTMGIMGWAHIYLDMGTVLIASVAIGLAVDDTIHFIARFRYHFDRLHNYDTALDETFYSVGPPITITSIVLFFGFGVLVVSTFMPVVYFGILAATTMVSALIADLFVLPALIKIFKPFGPEEGVNTSH